MKKYLKSLAKVGIVLYIAQAMVGIYFGAKFGIEISKNIYHLERLK